MKKKTFWIIVLAILAVDRITKELAPGIPADGLALIPGVIGLRYAENTGIAFSLLSGMPRLTGILAEENGEESSGLWLNTGYEPFPQSKEHL